MKKGMQLRRATRIIGMVLVTMLCIGVLMAGTNDTASAASKLKKGTTFTSGQYKYQVTSVSGSKGTASVVGVKSKSLKSATVPATVKKSGKTLTVNAIGSSAFKNCTKLTSVSVGTNVKTIGSSAFQGCTKLDTITIKGTKLTSVGKNALKGTAASLDIKVPGTKVASYRKVLSGKGQSGSADILCTSHKMSAWKTTKAATCTASGTEQRNCSVCGEVPETRSVKALGHNYGDWVTTREATCIAQGEQTRTCAACKATEHKVIPATGKHAWESEPTVDWDATCTISGRESIHCTVCGVVKSGSYTYIAPTGHTVKTAQTGKAVFRSVAKSTSENVIVLDKTKTTHTLGDVCVKCGMAVPRKQAEEHHFTLTAQRDPKHSKEVAGAYAGSKTYTCDICGYSYNETIPAPEHTLVEVSHTDPTCTDRGKRNTVCSVCGQEFFSYVGQPLGHDWAEEPTVDVKMTCTKDGKESIHCKRCNAVKPGSEEVIPKLGEHQWGDWTVEKKPTCTAEGMQTRTCARCGDKQTQTIRSLGGHNYNDGELVVIKEATCTEEGTMGRHCTNPGCDSVKATSKIQKKGHDWEETVTVAPTCTEAGSMSRYCKTCGAVEEDVVIPANGGAHDWSGTGQVVQGGGESPCVPTVEYRSCKYCDEKEYITVNAGSGHNWQLVEDSSIDYNAPSAPEKNLGPYMRCKDCGMYQIGCGSLSEWDVPESQRGPARNSYRCGWWAFFTTDMSQSEGFNNHQGIKCESVSEVRIVGGSSGYDDNQYTTISMKAPAPREGYRFVGWKNDCSGELIREDQPAADGRYSVKGDMLTLNWKAHEMTFTPVYEPTEAAAAAISAPTSTQDPVAAAPGTESAASEPEVADLPEEQVTAPKEDVIKEEDPATKPEEVAQEDPLSDDAA